MKILTKLVNMCLVTKNSVGTASHGVREFFCNDAIFPLSMNKPDQYQEIAETIACIAGETPSEQRPCTVVTSCAEYSENQPDLRAMAVPVDHGKAILIRCSRTR
jgi:hypothetical protein